VAYWIYCVFTMSLLLIWWDLFAAPPRPFMVVLSEVFQRFAPAAAASLIVVPLVVMDVLRMSNRFAGPARRLQNGLRELGEGKQVKPLIFRDNDFWQETAAEFNRVNDRIVQLVARQAHSSAEVADPEEVNLDEPELAAERN
jgi:methyl-accepting chemotaxis protein